MGVPSKLEEMVDSFGNRIFGQPNPRVRQQLLAEMAAGAGLALVAAHLASGTASADATYGKGWYSNGTGPLNIRLLNTHDLTGKTLPANAGVEIIGVNPENNTSATRFVFGQMGFSDAERYGFTGNDISNVGCWIVNNGKQWLTPQDWAAMGVTVSPYDPRNQKPSTGYLEPRAEEPPLFVSGHKYQVKTWQEGGKWGGAPMINIDTGFPFGAATVDPGKVFTAVNPKITYFPDRRAEFWVAELYAGEDSWQTKKRDGSPAEITYITRNFGAQPLFVQLSIPPTQATLAKPA